MKRTSILIRPQALFCVAAMAASLGCGRGSADGGAAKSGVVKVTSAGVSLHSEMSDVEILKEFRIEVADTDPQISRGSDGYTTEYALSEQKVWITRSAVTGLYVFSAGPIKGDWKLGPEL